MSSRPQSAPEPANPRIARFLPWAADYGRRTARDDALAGSTLAAYAVPSSIAYAQLGGDAGFIGAAGLARSAYLKQRTP